jgi:oligopeptide/dipeptide ABC transporter ATP-binding protein
MTALLQVQDLDVAYVSGAGAIAWALLDINVEVRPGETMGILGESGSGKSTLAAALLNLLPAKGSIRRGQILVEGEDVLRLGPGQLQKLRGGRISLIFQEPSLALHPTMRIGDQIGEVLRAHEPLDGSARRARVRKILAEVYLSDVERIAHSYPHQLSGGQRQRALIAQAIASRPKLVVADEPTASLDPTTQREILALFKTLREKLGIAIIFITHNPGLLAGLADRVLVLYAGRVVEWGPAEAVLFSPRHPYTKALLRCVPAFDEACATPSKSQLQGIEGVSPNSASLQEACAFAPRCADRMDVCHRRQPAGAALSAAHRVFCFKFSTDES